MSGAGDERDDLPRILWADGHLLAIAKPAGMPSVPARNPCDPPDAATVLAPAWGPLEAVHRLDRDTSGILLLARTAAARRQLGAAFAERAVRKEYVAVVDGRPPTPGGTLHLPLGPDPDRPPRQRCDPVAGRPSTTRWRSLATSAEQTLLLLEPLTGRSHQLRCHLAWLGVPIVGDPLYGRGRPVGRLLLHAARISFPHPVDGTPHTLLLPACFPPDGAPWHAADTLTPAPSAATPKR